MIFKSCFDCYRSKLKELLKLQIMFVSSVIIEENMERDVTVYSLKIDITQNLEMPIMLRMDL